MRNYEKKILHLYFILSELGKSHLMQKEKNKSGEFI
jgi:hypothetical protein